MEQKLERKAPNQQIYSKEKKKKDNQLTLYESTYKNQLTLYGSTYKANI